MAAALVVTMTFQWTTTSTKIHTKFLIIIMMKIKRNRFVCTKYSLIRLKRILRFHSISAFSEKMREKIRRAKAVNIEWDFVCVANAKQEEYIKAHTLHQILFLSIFGINAFFVSWFSPVFVSWNFLTHLQQTGKRSEKQIKIYHRKLWMRVYSIYIFICKSI